MNASNSKPDYSLEKVKIPRKNKESEPTHFTHSATYSRALFTIRIRDFVQGRMMVEVVSSPVGRMRRPEPVVFNKLVIPYVKKLANPTLEGEMSQEELIEMGQMLGDMLLPMQVRRMFMKSWEDEYDPTNKQGIRIMLELDDDKLAMLPWEYAYLMEYKHMRNLRPDPTALSTLEKLQQRVKTNATQLNTQQSKLKELEKLQEKAGIELDPVITNNGTEKVPQVLKEAGFDSIEKFLSELNNTKKRIHLEHKDITKINNQIKQKLQNYGFLGLDRNISIVRHESFIGSQQLDIPEASQLNILVGIAEPTDFSDIDTETEASLILNVHSVGLQKKLSGSHL